MHDRTFPKDRNVAPTPELVQESAFHPLAIGSANFLSPWQAMIERARARRLRGWIHNR